MIQASPRVLILGGNGMLGHRLWLSFRERFDTYVTLRAPAGRDAGPPGLYDPARTVHDVTAEDMASVVRAVEYARPSVIVNAIGLIKQRPDAEDPVACIEINACFPHRLAQVCGRMHARLIHVSTDCVFAGTRGGYTEADASDADDLYGRTKRLGEVTGPGCLTLRTSLIGRELSSAYGLIEWFLEAVRRGRTVHGRTRAIFSGLTTHEAAEVIALVIERHATLSGVLHVAAAPIAKFDLLRLVSESLGLAAHLIPDAGGAIDRSLDGTAFTRETGWSAPSWPALVARLAADTSLVRTVPEQTCLTASGL